MNARADIARAMNHHRHGRLQDAEAGYRGVLKHDPKNHDALHLLGTIVAQKGKAEEGIGLIERALAVAPSSVEAHFNLANIFTRLSRLADAERHFRAAFDLRPSHADAANGVGGVLLRTARYDEAETWLNKALSLNPSSVSALNNMGSLMDAAGRFDETLGFYDRALAADPNDADAHQFKALALLVRGRLAEGWAEYAWRFKRITAFHGRFPFPIWKGEPLTGRKILVWTEQGIGDEILIASMIPDLLRMGARVVLLCSARLVDLFARSFPDLDLIPVGGAPAHSGVIADVAFQASMSDLGLQLRPSLDAFPPASAYLTTDPARTDALREKYKRAAGTDRLIGLSWRSKVPDGNTDKSIPLTQWAALLRAPGCTFVNLQYGDTAAEVAAVERDLGVRILTDRDVNPLGDIGPFAAQVAALDHVVTVSNTTAHVAGGLGVPASVLIPANSGRLWYWFLERTGSPWYPSLRLFRQQRSGWEQTLNEVVSALALPTAAERLG